MEQKTISGLERTELKKGNTGRLRRAGRIPAVVYGHTGTHNISVDRHEFDLKFHVLSENTIITINLENRHFDVLVKDYQEDILTGNIQHIDFFEIEKGKVLKTHVPVHLKGIAPGVKEGGILEQHIHELEVECLPRDLPEDIHIEISGLGVGDTIHVSDIPALEGVKFLRPGDDAVVVVSHKKIVEEETAGEEAVDEGDTEEKE